MFALRRGWFALLYAVLVVAPAGVLASPFDNAPPASPAPPSAAAGQGNQQAAAKPDPNDYLPFQTIMKFGGKVYYMGRRYGMDGWFIVQEGKIQIAYTTSDKMGILFGVMLSSDGANITSQQVSQLSATEPDIKMLMNKGAPAGSPGFTPPAGQPSYPPTPAAAQAQQSPASTPTSGNWVDSATRSPDAPVEDMLSPPNPKTASSPGEILLSDFGSKAQGVTIGKPNAPLIVMVMDPQCPHCMQTWKDLYDDIKAGRLRLRLVPTGNDNPEHDKLAAGLLSASNAGKAWNDHVNGDSKGLEGYATPDMLAAIRSNHEMILKWGINKTPYLIYRGRDNQVKIVEGRPKSISALMADLPAAR